MSKDIAAALLAPFEEKDLKHRPGRSGMTFTYADVRAIDGRLDEVFGTMGWSFSWELVDAANAVVRGRLIVHHEGQSKTIEEAGYPNAAGRDEEPIKSSVTDSRRRAAAALGIGRGLYSPEKGVPVPLARVPRLSVAPTPLSVDSTSGSDPALDDAILAAKAAMLFAQNVGDETCSHGELWVWKEGVARATGKPYAFWAASHKTPDGAYCKDKPSQKFVASQSAAPAKPKLVPEDTQNLEDLPF
jgi:hypothetical protein